VVCADGFDLRWHNFTKAYRCDSYFSFLCVIVHLPQLQGVYCREVETQRYEDGANHERSRIKKNQVQFEDDVHMFLGCCLFFCLFFSANRLLSLYSGIQDIATARKRSPVLLMGCDDVLCKLYIKLSYFFLAKYSVKTRRNEDREEHAITMLLPSCGPTQKRMTQS
jgi:hypothetical protein